MLLNTKRSVYFTICKFHLNQNKRNKVKDVTLFLKWNSFLFTSPTPFPSPTTETASIKITEQSLQPYSVLLEKEMGTHSSILAWKIPWTEETGRLQSMEMPRVGHNWAAEHTHTFCALCELIHLSFPEALWGRWHYDHPFLQMKKPRHRVVKKLSPGLPWWLSG